MTASGVEWLVDSVCFRPRHHATRLPHTTDGSRWRTLSRCDDSRWGTFFESGIFDCLPAGASGNQSSGGSVMPYKDKAVRNAKQRERYAADAEYRERMQASNKASYERNWDSIQAHRKPVQRHIERTIRTVSKLLRRSGKQLIAMSSTQSSGSQLPKTVLRRQPVQRTTAW